MMIEEYGHIPDAFFLPQDEIGQLKKLKTERRFYEYRVIDYYGTGDGRSIYLQVSLNGSSNEHYKKEWEQFVNYEFYLKGTEELEEREFLDRYTRLLPNMIVHLLQEKTLTIYQNHFHFNRS